MGGAAKAVATVLTYPLQLAQCRLRVSVCFMFPHISSLTNYELYHVMV